MRKTFSIRDKVVLERLKQVENQSKYLEDLIRADIIRRKDISEYDIGVIFGLEMAEMAIRDIKDGSINNGNRGEINANMHNVIADSE